MCYHIKDMSAENSNYEICFALSERRGEKTEKLIQDIKELSKKYNIYDEVTLSNITASKTLLETDNTLEYSISIASPNNKKGENIINFLEHVTKKMFDKYPVFTEPSNRF